MKKLAIVRGKFLNQYEMQSFAPLVKSYSITAFGSLTPYHDAFPFPVVKLPCPMDFPDVPYNMPIINRLFTDSHYLIGLEKALRGFDIVHTAETYYRYTQQALDAKRNGRVKYVVATVLENIPYNNEGISGRKEYKKRSRRELDRIIALTKKTKDALVMEGADPKKITVIGHGIDTGSFQPEQDHFRKLGRSTCPLTILFSGRFEAYKGIFDILEAASILHNDPSIAVPLEFVFVGSGSGERDMVRKERELGLVSHVRHMHIPYTRMPDIYKKADIIIAPSVATQTWAEQYCTVLLEAQSMGIPIVTTRSGGIPENVGNCALFFKEANSVDLAFHIKKFIQDPDLRVHYGRKARERALKIHDAKRIAGRIDAVYRSLYE